MNLNFSFIESNSSIHQIYCSCISSIGSRGKRTRSLSTPYDKNLPRWS